MEPKPYFPNCKLATFGLATTMFGMFTYGIQDVILNIPQNRTQEFLHDSFQYYNGYPPSAEVGAFIWGAIVSIYALGAIVGSLSSSWAADKCGRKPILIYGANALCILGSVAMSLAFYANAFHWLLVGRFLLGLNSGITTTLVPVYLVECSPIHVRGFMASLHGFCADVINILGMTLSLPQLMGTLPHLPYLFAIQALPAFFQLVLSFLWPESPQYIYVQHDQNEEKTEKALTHIGVAKSEIPGMLQEFAKEAKLATNHKKGSLSWCQIFRIPAFRRALILCAVIGAVRNFTGSAAVHNFSTAMFGHVGMSQKGAEISSLIMAMLSILASGSSALLVERAGRRSLVLSTLWAIIIIWLLVFGLTSIQTVAPSTIGWSSWACIILLIISFSQIYPLGVGTIAWFLSAELVPEILRARASLVGITTLWGFYVITVQAYPPLTSLLGTNWTLIVLFVLPSMLGAIYLHIRLPETKQKPILEIMDKLSPQNSDHIHLLNGNHESEKEPKNYQSTQQ